MTEYFLKTLKVRQGAWGWIAIFLLLAGPFNPGIYLMPIMYNDEYSVLSKFAQDPHELAFFATLEAIVLCMLVLWRQHITIFKLLLLSVLAGLIVVYLVPVIMGIQIFLFSDGYVEVGKTLGTVVLTYIVFYLFLPIMPIIGIFLAAPKILFVALFACLFLVEREESSSITTNNQVPPHSL